MKAGREGVLRSTDSVTLGTAMRRVADQQSWLRLAGLLLLLLLGIDIASLGMPHLTFAAWQSETFKLGANRLINGLALLIGIYIIYQLYIHQTLINALAEEVEKVGGKDCVTNFYNRQVGEQRLLEEVARVTRKPRPLSIVRATIIGLNAADERIGRASMDCFIRMFAERVQQKLRRCDIPIRLERDEFLLILPECKPNSVTTVLNRLNGMTLAIGVGDEIPIVAGWADFSTGDSLQELFMRAERMLSDNRKTPSGHIGAIESVGPRSPNSRIAGLTPREREVFELLAKGKTNKEIANMLNISVNTVETHRGRIMNQLDVHSASELVIFAMQNGGIGPR